MKHSNKKRILTVLVISGILMLALIALMSGIQVPSFLQVKTGYLPSEAWLLDRHNEVISIKRINSKVRRLEWLSLKEISPAIQNYVIVSEDRRFYEHTGVDWHAVLASAWSNLLHILDGKHPRGASTVTMQLAGFIDPALLPASNKRTFIQKINQVLTAIEIEKNWSKEEILEAYFNLASFRGEIIGVHAASYALFGNHPSALNQNQSLLLVALLKGPLSKSALVSSRACAILKSSHLENNSTCEDLLVLAHETLDLHNNQLSQESIAPHLAQKLLTQPGVRIQATLDANLQRFAIQSIRGHLLQLGGQNVNDGAAIVIDNKTGEILAYVGSSGSLSLAADVDGIMALRQAGSTLKPMLYGMAISNKLLTAASAMDDSPIQINTPMGLYIPQNYDRDFKGIVSVRTALASSLNVPAVRTLGLIGVDSFVRTLRSYGLHNLSEDGNYYGLSLALGGVDINLMELTNAYRALANAGIWHPVKFINSEKVPNTPLQQSNRVVSTQAASIIANILADKSARALTFGLENPLSTRIWTAVKTGTSKDMRDNWCVGFSSRYTVGVWVGNFSGKPMKDVSGASGAAPIWRDIVEFLHVGKSSTQPQIPSGVVSRAVHFIPEIETPRNEWFVSGTEADVVRLVGNVKQGAAQYAKILYPTNGTVIAIDPDIPTNHQRVQFSYKGGIDVTWMLDGANVGSEKDGWWQPTSGNHELVMKDLSGNELDSVVFDVRGSALP